MSLLVGLPANSGRQVRSYPHAASSSPLQIDFKQAYDSIQQEKLYRIMHEFNIPNKVIRLVTATMRNSEAQVKIQTQLTKPFKIRQGLKQGNGLAPSLLKLALEHVIKKVTFNVKDHWNFKQLKWWAMQMISVF
jgi:hypothetical protein